MTPNYLIVPGWQNSESEHWQSLWEKKFQCARVEQTDWMQPRREDWVLNIVEAIKAQPQPPILITHSMGTNSSVIAAIEHGVMVAGAFLVSPVDLKKPSTPTELVGFLPTPSAKLSFPSVVIASENDPYCDIKVARDFSNNWGSQFVSVGSQGHINVAAGFGEWDAGEQLLRDFIGAV